jgi:hypothetical protein
VSKYHDDSTYATLPGKLAMSEAKLRELEPELFTDRTVVCSPDCAAQHPAAEMRERFAEQLEVGCCCPAKVVSLTPLVIAVHADDLDASVLLGYPLAFIDRYGLEVGKRLLAVNTYGKCRDTATNELLFAVDLLPGPNRTNWWSNFRPLIAELVCDDATRIAALHREIPEDEWARLDASAAERIAHLGLDTARSGKPSRAYFPARTRDGAYYLPHATLVRPPPRRPWLRTAILVATIAVLALLLLR